MKKYILVLIMLLIFIAGCGKKDEISKEEMTEIRRQCCLSALGKWEDGNCKSDASSFYYDDNTGVVKERYSAQSYETCSEYNIGRYRNCIDEGGEWINRNCKYGD